MNTFNTESILIQVYYISKQPNSTFAQDECWSISRRIGMLCYYLDNGTYDLGYKFENGGVVISEFQGRPGLTLVINGQHAFNDPRNFGLLKDYTYGFEATDYVSTLEQISEHLYNSRLFNRLIRFNTPIGNFNKNGVRQSVLLD
jgi:hypothetical protein